MLLCKQSVRDVDCQVMRLRFRCDEGVSHDNSPWHPPVNRLISTPWVPKVRLGCVGSNIEAVMWLYTWHTYAFGGSREPFWDTNPMGRVWETILNEC